MTDRRPTALATRSFRHYEGDWKIARWEHPESDAILGKWLRSIKAVQVEREPEPVTTPVSAMELAPASVPNGVPPKLDTVTAPPWAIAAAATDCADAGGAAWTELDEIAPAMIAVVECTPCLFRIPLRVML